jgi:hypothetical protein
MPYFNRVKTVLSVHGHIEIRVKKYRREEFYPGTQSRCDVSSISRIKREDKARTPDSGHGCNHPGGGAIYTYTTHFYFPGKNKDNCLV